MRGKRATLLLLTMLAVAAIPIQMAGAGAMANSASDDPPAAPEVPKPQIFAPGVISGPAANGSPTFSPDGNTIYFTRSNGAWGGIVESHKVKGEWQKPTLAPFSGQWSDSSMGMAPDGSYLVFSSKRPIAPLAPGADRKDIHSVANLWRVDRTASGWSEPVRLPETVNIGRSIWKPSIAANGDIYFVSIDDKGAKRLYCAEMKNGVYQPAQPLPFSGGTTLDVDPEIAPDESFLIFVSAGRRQGSSLDQMYIVARQGDGWGPVVPIRYAGDENPSTDDEPHLGPDHRTIYFSSDRQFPVNYPRTPEQAKEDFKRMESVGWFGGYANVWTLPLEPFLSAAVKAMRKPL